MTKRRLGAYLAVALIAGACGPGYGRATAEPTPRVTYGPPAPTNSSQQTYWYCWDVGDPDPHHLGYWVEGDHFCSADELNRP